MVVYWIKTSEKEYHDKDLCKTVAQNRVPEKSKDVSLRMKRSVLSINILVLTLKLEPKLQVNTSNPVKFNIQNTD